MPFDHTKIEPKWQKYWDENKTFKTDCYDDSKPKYYCMDMFPYPSGNGLHVGHPEGYTATDIVSRMKRMQGYNVLHPMGFDSFGLPAEQFAIQTGHHPAEFTKKNIDVFLSIVYSVQGTARRSYSMHPVLCCFRFHGLPHIFLSL